MAGENATKSFADGIESWLSASISLDPLMADILVAAGIFLIFLAFSFIAKYIVRDIAPKFVAHTKSSLDDELLGAIRRPTQAFIIVVGLYLACTTINGLPADIMASLDTLASIALIMIGGYFTASVISGLLRWYLKDVAPHTDSDLDDHLIPFIDRILVAVVYVLAFLMAISRLGIEITPLLASMGVAGVAVALAAKESLSNFFGAVSILADRPYKVGDRISVKGVSMGDVIDVGLRSTRVRTLDNKTVIIPNEELARSKIVNYALPDPMMRLSMKVNLAYGPDIDKACAVIEETAASLPSSIKDKPPRAYVTALGDFAVEVTLHVWIDSYRQDLNVPDEFYRRILARFRREGIRIPMPYVTVKPAKD